MLGVKKKREGKREKKGRKEDKKEKGREGKERRLPDIAGWLCLRHTFSTWPHHSQLCLSPHFLLVPNLNISQRRMPRLFSGLSQNASCPGHEYGLPDSLVCMGAFQNPYSPNLTPQLLLLGFQHVYCLPSCYLLSFQCLQGPSSWS